MHQYWISLALIGFTTLTACQKENPNPKEQTLRFSMHFDATQERLNNIGQPTPIPAGNAAQTPDFRGMSVHYIELAPSALTLLGQGAIVYQGPETNAGTETAVDFNQATVATHGEVFYETSIGNLPPGTYEWVRVSVTYQNYDIRFNLKNVPVIGELNQQKGTIASFVGFNTYISEITPRSQALAVNTDKRQGFWAFETNFTAPYDAYNILTSGQAPEGATTVVNPLFLTSPVPQGSCVVTGKFAEPLVITGQETGPVEVRLSFSVNHSFEWVDTNGNGQLDFYTDAPEPVEPIVDMGLRGLVPTWEK
jgi:hypothetical protein